MNPAADPLSELRDIHLPTPVGWWPPAPGWWLLAFLLIGLIAVAAVAVRRARRSPRRAALAEVAHLRRTHQRDPQANILAAALSSLLRRYALARFPGESVAGLTGERWLAFLERNGGGAELSTGAGHALLTEPYRGNANVEAEQLIASVEAWIKRARPPNA